MILSWILLSRAWVLANKVQENNPNFDPTIQISRFEKAVDEVLHYQLENKAVIEEWWLDLLAKWINETLKRDLSISMLESTLTEEWRKFLQELLCYYQDDYPESYLTWMIHDYIEKKCSDDNEAKNLFRFMDILNQERDFYIALYKTLDELWLSVNVNDFNSEENYPVVYFQLQLKELILSKLPKASPKSIFIQNPFPNTKH